jgi:hypothetical protein
MLDFFIFSFSACFYAGEFLLFHQYGLLLYGALEPFYRESGMTVKLPTIGLECAK